MLVKRVKLKECLTTAQVLSLPQGDEEYVIYTDAYNQGYGAILCRIR